MKSLSFEKIKYLLIKKHVKKVFKEQVFILKRKNIQNNLNYTGKKFFIYFK